MGVSWTKIDIDFSLAIHNRTGKYFIGRDIIETPGLSIGDIYYWRCKFMPKGLLRRLIGRLQLWQELGKTVGGSLACRILALLPQRQPSDCPLLHMDPVTVSTTALRKRDIVMCHDLGPITHPALFHANVGLRYAVIYTQIAEVGPTKASAMSFAAARKRALTRLPISRVPRRA
jgi:hypothetical protein